MRHTATAGGIWALIYVKKKQSKRKQSLSIKYGYIPNKIKHRTEFDSTYAPAAIRGPRLLRDCRSSSQSRLCSLWHRWFGTYWSSWGTRGRCSSETRSWLWLSLTAWWGLLWRSRVGLTNRTTWRPAFWSGGLRLGCFTCVTMKKKNLFFYCFIVLETSKRFLNFLL